MAEPKPPPFPPEAPTRADALTVVSARLAKLEREYVTLGNELSHLRDFVNRQVTHLASGIRMANEKAEAASSTLDAATRAMTSIATARHALMTAKYQFVLGALAVRGILAYALWFLAALLWQMLRARLP